MSTPTPLSDRRLLIYASGNFGKNLLWGTVDMTLMFLLTDRLALPAGLAGGLIFASLVLDAVLYPWAGWLTDRLRAPLGRYGPLILSGTPLAVLAFFALFTLTGAQAPVWLIATALALFRIGYVALDLSHNALLTLISPAVNDNGRIAVARFLFSSLATLTLAAVLPRLIHPAADLTGLAAILALGAGLAILMAWASVRSWDRNTPVASRQRGGLRLLLNDRRTLLILAAGATASLFLPLFNKACLYFAAHWIGNPHLTSWLLGALVVGQIAGLPLWLYLSPRWPKTRIMQLAHGLCASGFLLAALGFIALNSATPLIMACAALAGIGLSGVYALIWALLSDAAADIEARLDTSVGGQLFAWAIFLQKAGMGVGAGLFGLALSAAGYEAGATPPIARDVMFAFTLLLPAMGSLICMGLLNMCRSAQTVRQR
ncbi:MFS transporter [Asticcacaulis sp. AND118]|uniref:MFS transporter n=1 Tax=Asticcacaulis sp. AND118 TaxID=2840468 RepID=UPI001CFFE0AF|nr:MFS transporter [Asticcacaulis sp. AND118]UDF05428.1 MFS transporter [Asticcacaulis sp. AND118]